MSVFEARTDNEFGLGRECTRISGMIPMVVRQDYRRDGAIGYINLALLQDTRHVLLHCDTPSHFAKLGVRRKLLPVVADSEIEHDCLAGLMFDQERQGRSGQARVPSIIGLEKGSHG